MDDETPVNNVAEQILFARYVTSSKSEWGRWAREHRFDLAREWAVDNWLNTASGLDLIDGERY